VQEAYYIATHGLVCEGSKAGACAEISEARQYPEDKHDQSHGVKRRPHDLVQREHGASDTHQEARCEEPLQVAVHLLQQLTDAQMQNAHPFKVCWHARLVVVDLLSKMFVKCIEHKR